jgi:hypothetical protein
MIKFFHKLGLLIPPLGKTSRALKICAAYLRSKMQKRSLCDSKGNPIIIYALPKSGSTWLESMLSSLDLYGPFMPWQASVEEFRHGHSDDYKLKVDHIRGIRSRRAVIKIHSRPNKEVLRTNDTLGLPYIVLTRNIDEALESHVHYARKTKYHPDYRQFQRKSLAQCFDLARRENFAKWSKWTADWNNVVDNKKLMVDYEGLLTNTEFELTRIVRHLNLRIDKRELTSIIEQNSIENMRNNAVQKSFFRGSKIN